MTLTEDFSNAIIMFAEYTSLYQFLRYSADIRLDPIWRHDRNSCNSLHYWFHFSCHNLYPTICDWRQRFEESKTGFDWLSFLDSCLPILCIWRHLYCLRTEWDEDCYSRERGAHYSFRICSDWIDSGLSSPQEEPARSISTYESSLIFLSITVVMSMCCIQ